MISKRNLKKVFTAAPIESAINLKPSQLRDVNFMKKLAQIDIVYLTMAPTEVQKVVLSSSKKLFTAASSLTTNWVLGLDLVPECEAINFMRSYPASSFDALTSADLEADPLLLLRQMVSETRDTVDQGVLVESERFLDLIFRCVRQSRSNRYPLFYAKEVEKGKYRLVWNWY